MFLCESSQTIFALNLTFSSEFSLIIYAVYLTFPFQFTHLIKAKYLQFYLMLSLIQFLRTQTLSCRYSLFSSMQSDKYQDTKLNTLKPPQLKFQSYFGNPQSSESVSISLSPN